MDDLDRWTRWAGLPESELLWEPVGGDWMVYAALSGQTHFLNPTGALILRLLQTEPDTAEGACRRLCQTLDLKETPDLHQRIGGILKEFHHGGLICSLPT